MEWIKKIGWFLLAILIPLVVIILVGLSWPDAIDASLRLAIYAYVIIIFFIIAETWKHLEDKLRIWWKKQFRKKGYEETVLTKYPEQMSKEEICAEACQAMGYSEYKILSKKDNSTQWEFFLKVRKENPKAILVRCYNKENP